MLRVVPMQRDRLTAVSAGNGAPDSARHRRLLSVDVLRGVAALAVVLTHIPRTNIGEIGFRFFFFLPLDFGALGVPLFLVLSGFCIHLGVARRMASGHVPRADWAQFWKRRFYRLYPPYLAAIALSVAIYYATRSHAIMYEGNPITDLPRDLLCHLFLVQNLTQDFSGGLANPAFWTLGLEEQLYGLFAVALLLRSRLPCSRVLGVGLTISVFWRVGWVIARFLLARYGGTSRAEQGIDLWACILGNWEAWPLGWWFLWLLGAMAAEAYVGLVKLPQWCFSMPVAFAGALFCFVTYFRTLGRYTQFWLTDEGALGFLRLGLNCVGSFSEPVFGVACFVILNRWVKADKEGRFGGRLVVWLSACGLVSYSLYLTHIPALRLMQVLLPIGGTSIASVGLRILIYTPASVAIAVVFFLSVERWFLTNTRPTSELRQNNGLAQDSPGEPPVVTLPTNSLSPESAGG